MKFFVATVLLATFLVAQGRYTSIEFDKLYNEISNKNGGRITQGSKATLGQFPYQALLLVALSGNPMPIYVCSGALINNNYVLTAAVCIEGYGMWYVKLGGILRTETEASSIIMPSDVAIMHEKYNSDSHQNDIGLIRLPVPVQYTAYIKPLRLPSRSEIGYDLNSNIVRVSGWGKTSDSGLVSNQLMYADVSAMSNIDCQKYFGSSITSSSLCTRGFTGQSACDGDNGGPLTRVAEDGIRTHIGIVSHQFVGGCTLDYPVVYTRTTSYLDWISQRTGIAIRP